MAAYTAVVTGNYNTNNTWGDATEECVTNGSFASDTGWTKSAGSVTIAGGVLVFTNAASGANASQTPATTKRIQSGRIYTTTYTVSGLSGSEAVKIGLGGTFGTVRTADGTYTEDVTAGSDGTIKLQSNFSSTTCTFDNVSVMVKTAGYPSAAGDTFTIPSDVTVTVNSQESNDLGAATVNGILSFATNANSRLYFGNVTMTVGATGTLKMGTTGAAIPSSYTAELYFNTTGENLQGITVSSGGQLLVEGDPAYYGSDFDTTLSANWASGQSFTTTDDMSAKWAVGQKILVHKNALYSAYNTDVVMYTIASISGTTVTISEAAPSLTFNAGGLVLNVSRNVVIGKKSATFDAATQNSNNPKITFSTSGACTIKYARMTGCGLGLQSMGFSTTQEGCVVSNQGRAMYSSSAAHTVTDCIMHGMQSTFDTMTGGGTVSGSYFCALYNAVLINFSKNFSFSACNFFSNLGCFPSGFLGITITDSNLFGNSNAVTGCNALLHNCNLYKNVVALYGGSSGRTYLNSCNIYNNTSGHNYSSENGQFVKISGGRIGYDASDTSSPNTTRDFALPLTGKIVLDGVKLPAAGLTISNRNTANCWDSKLCSSDHDRVAGAQYIYDRYVDIIRNITTVRTGGASESLEVVPQSNCSTINPNKLVEWFEDAVPASAQTRSIRVLGSGFSANYPTAVQFYLEAEYFDSATSTNFSRGSIASSQVLSDNTTWTELSVSFTPTKAGQVRYRIWYKTYAASTKVYVDHALYGADGGPQYPAWIDGESTLQARTLLSSGGSPVIGSPIIRKLK